MATSTGQGHDEVVIAHTEPFDFDRADRDWKNVTPVRVLRHSKKRPLPNCPMAISLALRRESWSLRSTSRC